MTKKILFTAAVVFMSANLVRAQSPSPGYVAADPVVNMANDISRIAASVQTMTKALRDFVDKFAKVEGITLSEKQQRLIMGMQLLVQAEQRAATLQKYHVDLVEKENAIRTKLAQVEAEMNPQMIDRNFVYEGSTQTPELKENRRRALQAERANLTSLLQQLQANTLEAAAGVRESLSLVMRLRRTYLPQIERELADPYGQ